MTDNKELNKFIPIKGFEDYMINKDGVIYNLKYERFLNPNKPTVGLYKILLADKPKRIQKSIDKLVYEHFSNNNVDNLSKCIVTHIDGDESNHNINNLQLVTHKQIYEKRRKQHNRSSKYIGASWYTRRNKWRSVIEIDYISYHLGYFNHAENATYVYHKVAQYFKDSKSYYNELLKELTLPEEHENRDDTVNKMINKITASRDTQE